MIDIPYKEAVQETIPQELLPDEQGDNPAEGMFDAFDGFTKKVATGFDKRKTPLSVDTKFAVEADLIYENLLSTGENMASKIWGDIHQRSNSGLSDSGEYFSNIWSRFRANDPSLAKEAPREASYVMTIFHQAMGFLGDIQGPEGVPNAEN